MPCLILTKLIQKGFALAVAFSATIGGSGCLIASMANIVLKGYFDERYPNRFKKIKHFFK